MRLNAPKQITWWIALIIEVIGVLAYFIAIPVLSGIVFWILLIGFVLLFLGHIFRESIKYMEDKFIKQEQKIKDLYDHNNHLRKNLVTIYINIPNPLKH